MNQQPLQTSMNLWALPLITPIINGAGQILGELGSLGLAMVISSISRSHLPLDKSEESGVVLELRTPKKLNK